MKTPAHLLLLLFFLFFSNVSTSQDVYNLWEGEDKPYKQRGST